MYKIHCVHHSSHRCILLLPPCGRRRQQTVYSMQPGCSMLHQSRAFTVLDASTEHSQSTALRWRLQYVQPTACTVLPCSYALVAQLGSALEGHPREALKIFQIMQACTTSSVIAPLLLGCPCLRLALLDVPLLPLLPANGWEQASMGTSSWRQHLKLDIHPQLDTKQHTAKPIAVPAQSALCLLSLVVRRPPCLLSCHLFGVRCLLPRPLLAPRRRLLVPNRVELRDERHLRAGQRVASANVLGSARWAGPPCVRLYVTSRMCPAQHSAPLQLGPSCTTRAPRLPACALAAPALPLASAPATCACVPPPPWAWT